MSIIDQAARRLAELQAKPPATPVAVASEARPVVVPVPVRGHPELTLLDSSRPTGADTGPASPQEVSTGAAIPLPQARGEPQTARSVDLDLPALEQAGYLVDPRKRSMLGEEFRRLKRPLLRSWQQRKTLGSVLVTSAVPGEGKTFFALNLAMSLAAEIDMHVLLVDADVAHPQAMRRLGVGEGAAGLLDLVAGQAAAGETILRTNIPNLELLPAGAQRPASTELLASDAMRDAMMRLQARRKNQIVVVDGPPLLATNDAQVLASQVDQVIVVVASGSTPRALVEQALESIEQCPLVSTVLNKSEQPAVPGGYGYY